MSHKKISTTQQGITLIEVLIYSALLSLLFAGFISCAYGIHMRDLILIDEINDSYTQTHTF